jgi:hypothetical protein
MSSLLDLSIVPVMDTSEHDLTLEFFKLLLSVSVTPEHWFDDTLVQKHYENTLGKRYSHFH